ncbi:ABC transporter ATP-binding protein [Aggregicoccus sp. 17bor-14]|uniref:ABC transporter ATP-binding protein n=1 Tax=Myxococcaceae TaxID=31 RepID=UPI00351A4662
MKALDDVSLEVRAGEVLAIVGENGAGKTTLMNVLYGLYHPDAGEVRFGGEPVRLKSPRDAISRGVGMVHQHFMLLPSLSVAENVVLGKEPRRRGLLDLEAAYAQVAEVCERYGFRLDPRAPVESLSVGSQQKVEIVKALYRGAQVLVLDEPTAVLTPQEAEELLGVVRGLAAQGRTVLFISHKLSEVLRVADRIAVMRRGRLVAELRASEASAERLADLMVGNGRAKAGAAETLLAELSPTATSPAEPSPAGPSAPGVTVLEAQGLEARDDEGRPALRGVSLRVRAGEIVGVAGVDGNGQRELAEVLTGLRPLSGGAGTLLGGPLAGLTPALARSRGVGHIPEDRLARAVVKSMSVEENVALGRQTQAPFARGPFVDFASRRSHAEQLLVAYDVRPRAPGAQLGSLSGGNQQKVVVARELDAGPGLLVVMQPTRGLDIGAVAQVRARLREARARGAGILLLSLDLDEVLALSDRVYVLYAGKVNGEFAREAFDVQELGRRMLGAQHG